MFNRKESADDSDLRELYRMRGEIDRQIREIESRKKKLRQWLDDLRESIRKQFAAVDLSGLKKGGDMNEPNQVSVAFGSETIYDCCGWLVY